LQLVFAQIRFEPPATKMAAILVTTWFKKLTVYRLTRRETLGPLHKHTYMTHTLQNTARAKNVLKKLAEDSKTNPVKLLFVCGMGKELKASIHSLVVSFTAL
jgi:hypothetical protein